MLVNIVILDTVSVFEILLVIISVVLMVAVMVVVIAIVIANVVVGVYYPSVRSLMVMIAVVA
jgi:hypothetical protein